MQEPPATPAKRGVDKLSGIGRRYFDLIEFDDNEELICEIRKHPIGLFFIYLSGFLISVLILISTILISSSGVLSDIGQEVGSASGGSAARTIFLVAGFVLTGLSLVMTIIYGILYEHNVIFVTNEKIAQVIYKTIFDRKISQLSIGDVQDVTVAQTGILARLFNYGTLVVETAGEQQNYTFNFVPAPYQSSKDIVGAHERNLVKYGN